MTEKERFLLVQFQGLAEALYHGPGKVALALDDLLEKNRRLEPGLIGEIPVGEITCGLLFFRVVIGQEQAVVDVFK